MTVEEFQRKHNINKFNLHQILGVLDILYLEYTKEQALAMVEDYLDHADEIYNSIKALDE